jgi:hypothetical protein
MARIRVLDSVSVRLSAPDEEALLVLPAPFARVVEVFETVVGGMRLSIFTKRFLKWAGPRNGVHGQTAFTGQNFNQHI